MEDSTQARELSDLRATVRHLQEQLDRLEQQQPPQTMLLDDQFLKRAFAVFGHYLVASLLIAVPIYLLIGLVFGVFYAMN